MTDQDTTLDAAVEADPEVQAAEVVEASSMSALIAKRAAAKARQAAAPVKPVEPAPVPAPVVDVVAPVAPPAKPMVPPATPAEPVAEATPPVVEPVTIGAPAPVAPPATTPVPPAKTESVTPAPKLTPWTATGRTRKTGVTFDFATGRAVSRIETEYARAGAGRPVESAWTSTGAPPA